MTAPAHWPNGVEYLNSLRFHSSVDPESLKIVQGSGNNASENRNSHSVVVIRRISSPVHHPAFGQHGLFAAKKIPAKSHHIIDYLGEVHCDERPTSDYDLSLYRTAKVSIGIDAASMGNEARFVNDFRGIREKPNARFEERRTEIGGLLMSIWSIETIKKGEEIVVSYGKSWWSSRNPENIVENQI